MIFGLDCKGWKTHNLAIIAFEAYPPSILDFVSQAKQRPCIWEEAKVSKP
jgi:hypothetical protein